MPPASSVRGFLAMQLNFVVSSDERLARVALSRLTEPGEPKIASLVAQDHDGAVELILVGDHGDPTWSALEGLDLGDRLTLRTLEVTVETGGRKLTSRPRVSDQPAELGPQDFVIIAVKGPALPAVVRTIGPLLGPETAVVFALNGIVFVMIGLQLP